MVVKIKIDGDRVTVSELSKDFESWHSGNLPTDQYLDAILWSAYFHMMATAAFAWQ